MSDVVKKSKKRDRTDKSAKHQHQKLPALLMRRRPFVNRVKHDSKTDGVSKKYDLDTRHLLAQNFRKASDGGKKHTRDDHIISAQMVQNVSTKQNFSFKFRRIVMQNGLNL